MNELLEVARQILELNPNTSLTGSLMLKLRGMDLGREIKDIDILICDNAPNIKFPEEWKVTDKGYASDGSSAKYEYNGITIDVLGCGEQPEIVDGIPLGQVKSLLDVKYKYSLQNNSDAPKHHEDLVRLGYEFPKMEPFDISDLF